MKLTTTKTNTIDVSEEETTILVNLLHDQLTGNADSHVYSLAMMGEMYKALTGNTGKIIPSPYRCEKHAV